MKIVIALVVLALIYFLYKKFTSGKNTPEELISATSDQDEERISADSLAQDMQSTADSAIDSTTGAATAAVAATVTETETASKTASTSTVSTRKSLPIEHLEGIDRSAGKALRALGISDLVSLQSASAATLETAGYSQSESKVLLAQAALSELPGATSSETTALAKSGIDSVADLAQQDPAALVAKVAQANRGSATLKSALGVQQLQRLVSTAKEAV